jgi:flagellin
MGITRINSNISALTAQRNINATGTKLATAIERLSSGLRINRASDDSAGMSVANRLKTQTEGLNVAIANAQDGINLISVAEGALQETTSRLSRIRELSLQAANTGTNDYKARLAIQDEVFQSIEEITRIANTTQFGSNFLLNGDFSIKSELKSGQSNFGAHIDVSPVASSLSNGTSYLNIKQTKIGYSQIVAGDAPGGQQILNTGIRNQTDVAVSLARFSKTSLTGARMGDSDALVGAAGDRNFFNGVSIQNGDVFVFSGVLADGVTKYNGTLSLSSTTTFTQLQQQVQLAIDNAEKSLFGVSTTASVPSSFGTTVTIAGTAANAGRLVFFSESNYINQSDFNISLLRSGNIVTQSNGVTRSGTIGIQSALSGVGKVGNSVTAITGSTFGTGQFTIEVQDMQSAQQRKVSSTIMFQDQNGAVINRTTTLTGTGTQSIVLNGSFVGGIYTGGTTLQNGDTITLTGTNSDGTTFQGVFTYDKVPASPAVEDTTLNDFRFNSMSGLIKELNYRTRDYTGASTSDGVQTRFENALFTYSTAGVIELIDDLAQSNSQTQFTLTFQNGASHVGSDFTFQDNAVLAQEGYAEQATFRISGGEVVRAEAGDVITLFGAKSTVEGVPQEQVTFRVGTGFSAGTDTLVTVANEYTGRLNGGEAVTFGAGEQDVVFKTLGTTTDPAKFVTIDFDSIINVTSSGTGTDAGLTILISTVNTGLNFQIGGYSGQNINFSIGDLKADNLGFGRGSGRTVQNIDVTTLSGANEALSIIDEALDQVNRTRSILGAATNRLQSTMSNLSVASENLTASESRIRDADIAAETSRFTLNQVMLQAGVSVLAQANFQSQGFLTLLG